jgi:hypothetical protein
MTGAAVEAGARGLRQRLMIVNVTAFGRGGPALSIAMKVAW